MAQQELKAPLLRPITTRDLEYTTARNVHDAESLTLVAVAIIWVLAWLLLGH